MNTQKGVIHLVVPLLLLLVIGAGVYILISLGVIKNPLKNIPIIGNIGTKEAAVKLKTEYKNPFDKKTQFVNPFDKYKNPFVVNR